MQHIKPKPDCGDGIDSFEGGTSRREKDKEKSSKTPKKK